MAAVALRAVEVEEVWAASIDVRAMCVALGTEDNMTVQPRS